MTGLRKFYTHPSFQFLLMATLSGVIVVRGVRKDTIYQLCFSV